MTGPDLYRIVAALPPGPDRELLRDALAAGYTLVKAERTPEAERRENLPARNAIVQEYARTYLTMLPITIAAKRMADHLADPEDIADATQRAALHTIRGLDAGKAMSWVTIYRVLAGSKNDEFS